MYNNNWIAVKAEVMIEDGQVKTQKEAAELIAKETGLAASTIEKKITAGKKERAKQASKSFEYDQAIKIAEDILADNELEQIELNTNENREAEIYEEAFSIAIDRAYDELNKARGAANHHRMIMEEISPLLDDVMKRIEAENDPDEICEDIFEIGIRLRDMGLNTEADIDIQRTVFVALNRKSVKEPK